MSEGIVFYSILIGGVMLFIKHEISKHKAHQIEFNKSRANGSFYLNKFFN